MIKDSKNKRREGRTETDKGGGKNRKMESQITKNRE